MIRGSILSVFTLLTVAVSSSNVASAPALPPQTLTVSATVVSLCDIGSSSTDALVVGTIDFGSPPLTAGQTLPASGQMPIRCNSASAQPLVTLDYGENAKGTQRNLKGPTGALIGYDLLRGPAPDSPRWDDQAYSVPISPNQTEFVKIYGLISRIPDGTVDGHYSDTVKVQLDY